MPAASLLLLVLAYLVGTVPTAQLVAGRWGVDPTVAGSHNPGAANVTRLAGRRAGLLVLAGDLGKGVLATAIGLAVGGRSLALLCGLAVVLGHVLPVTRWFRGGKGVATAAGVALVLWPAPAGVLALVWLVALAVSRRASIASIAAAACGPAAVALAGASPADMIVVTAIGVSVIARHHDNLRRIRRGTEPLMNSGP
jgi:glycerol-3-phosphate acyltransferase PlsY